MPVRTDKVAPLPDVPHRLIRWLSCASRSGPGGQSAETATQKNRTRLVLLLCVVAVLIISVRAWAPLALSGYFYSHDPWPPMRLFEMDRCFQDGQIPCRWAGDTNMGYGTPMFNYYGPLPYYVGEVIHLLGLGFLDTAEILFAAGFLLSGIFMFLLVREFGGNLGGVVAASFYMYAPYRAVDVYVRGALNEHLAIAFFPAVLWGIYKLIQEGKRSHVVLLALSVAALLLTHNLMVMILLPVSLAWAAVFVLVKRRWASVAGLAVAGGLALLLAAFFTLPALLEQELTHLDEVRKDYYNYANHFPRLRQLFLERFWGFDGSMAGDGDGMSFQIGWLHSGAVAAFLPVAALIGRRRPALLAAIAVMFVAFWSSVFLMNHRSDFVWRTLTVLQWQQFPWRFLALAIFSSSFLAGVIVMLARRPILRVVLAASLIVAVLTLNQEFFRLNRMPAANDEQYLSGYWTLLDYLPAAASEVPVAPVPAKVEALDGDATISDLREGSDTLTFRAESQEGARLRIAISDFAGWAVAVDGKTVDHSHTGGPGAITFVAPPGEHRVELRLGDTFVRRLSNYLSLFAWLTLVAVLLAWLARAVFRRVAGRWAATPEVVGAPGPDG